MHAAFHSAPMLSTRVPTVLSYCSTGISTCCPSATTLVLALATYPGQISFTLETLDIRPRGFPPLSLLIPAFSSIHSTAPSHFASLRINAPLMMSLDIPQLRCRVSAPDIFGAGASRPVSYYALFECMAASEPTSWLSLKSHILFHLTRTLGP